MIPKYIKHQEAKERREEQRQGKMMGYCNMSFEDGSTKFFRDFAVRSRK
jgi:hypothetical protein